jgi:EmrB/QacA subfamily drug resistance transporter
VVISLAQLMLVLDELIVNTALPHVQRALHFSGTSLEWVVTGYAVTFGGLLLLGGRAGDIVGRRRMFISGILTFSLASLFGGLATSEGWLIAARALQGIGAAMAAPAALSLITVTFPEGKHRTRALSIYAAMTGMGGAIGLIAGGLLTTYATWRWVFFVNVVIGLPLALATRYAIPETTRHPRRFDLPGTVTGSLGFALLVYGLSHGATGPDGVSHWRDAATVLTLAGALVSLSSFVLIESRTAEPLLPLRILRDRNRVGVYVMLLFLAAAFFGMFFFVTLFLQTVWGYSAIRAGSAYLPFIGTFIIVSGICSQIVPRIGVRIPMTIGAPTAAGALFWLSRVGVHSHS